MKKKEYTNNEKEKAKIKFKQIFAYCKIYC